MISYRELHNILEALFEGCELKHIGRGSIEEADALANIGSMCSPIPEGAFSEVINKRSIKYKPQPNPTIDSGLCRGDLNQPTPTLCMDLPNKFYPSNHSGRNLFSHTCCDKSF